MPRRPMTASERLAASARMKRAWKTRRLRKTKAARVTQTLLVGTPTNGTVHVDHRIVLHVADHEMLLSIEEARVVLNALSQALPTP